MRRLIHDRMLNAILILIAFTFIPGLELRASIPVGAFKYDDVLPDESLRWIPLYELDRQPDIDHLTTFFVPAKPFTMNT